MGKRKPLTVKEQTEQLRIIDEKAVEASLRKLRLQLAKIRLKASLEKASKPIMQVKDDKDRKRKEELRQIEKYVQAGNVEMLEPGRAYRMKRL